MISEKYVPVLKTTDAELKGYSELSDSVKDSLLPLFELTKSRKTKLEPFGNIEKRMDKLKELVGDRRFILDLTSHEDMANYQIEYLQNEEDGFANWRNFLAEHSDFQIVPMIHVVPDALEETTSLVSWLAKNYDQYALRVESFDADISEYLSAVLSGCDDLNRLILVVDAGFVDAACYDEKFSECRDRCFAASSIFGLENIAIVSSSFPKSVIGHTSECEDHEGQFPKFDLPLKSRVESDLNLSLIYGDYASIHPVRYQVGGGTWVPRVDFPTQDSYIYTRYRRANGGYVEAAKAMVKKGGFELLDCWGFDEIIQAANDKPNGLSPSYWIAVRLNMHVTREALRVAG